LKDRRHRSRILSYFFAHFFSAPRSFRSSRSFPLPTLARFVLITAALVALAARIPAAVADTAAAERSAAACYAEVNAIRARVGAAPVSATAQPALAQAAASHAAYRVRADLGDVPASPLVRLARSLGLASGSSPDGSAHQETPGLHGYTGATPWERTKAAGLRDGSWRVQAEDVTTSSGTADVKAGVHSWLDAPYHRFPLLDANVQAAGCGAATHRFGRQTRSAEVLEMTSAKVRTRRLSVYPTPGQTGVPTSFNRLQEHPSPFQGAAQMVGYVVSIQADGFAGLKVQDMHLTEGAGHTPVAILKSVRAGAGTIDSELPANAAILAATRPLAAHTTYHVRISGSVQSDQGAWHPFPTRSWSFTTA
jgi:uncharacterized protein YkwD